MERKNYEQLLPLRPDEKAVAWARKKSCCDKKHLILYKNDPDIRRDPLTGLKTRAVRLECSACGGVSKAVKLESQCCCTSYTSAPFGWLHPKTDEAVISGGKSTCPICGAEADVEFMRDGRKACWSRDGGWFMTVERVGELLVLCGWYIKKEILRDRGTETLREEIRVLPYQAYVFEKKKAVYLRGYEKWFSRLTFTGRWEQKNRCMDEWGTSGEMGIAPWNRKLLDGSSCENSKLDRYLRITGKGALPVTYLRLWQKHRNVENLVMQGAGALLHELMNGEAHRTYTGFCSGVPKIESINWKENRPAQMLGLTKEEFCICREEKWDKLTWEFVRDCNQLGIRLKLPEDLELCRKVGLYGLIRYAKDGGALMPTVRYLAKQKHQLHYLQDYWRMARNEGYDLNIRQVKWPKDLTKAHDRVLREAEDRQRRERDEREKARNKALGEAFRKAAERLSWAAMEKDGICIRICAAPEELDHEGKTLSHCVATYKDKHAEGRSAIFFVRRTKEPDKPWYTLELDLKELRVIQNRGKSNCDRTEAVKAFEESWLAYVKANAGKMKDKKERKKTA